MVVSQPRAARAGRRLGGGGAVRAGDRDTRPRGGCCRDGTGADGNRATCERNQSTCAIRAGAPCLPAIASGRDASRSPAAHHARPEPGKSTPVDGDAIAALDHRRPA